MIEKPLSKMNTCQKRTPDKFQNKYRIAPVRLQNWDYRWSAAYFITICTADRQHFFGEIADSRMRLSHQGILADVFWYEIKNHSRNVELGAFVVMPNHIHGIVVLNRNDAVTDGNEVDDGNVVDVTGGDGIVGVDCVVDAAAKKTIGQQRFRNQGKNSLSSIVGSYKSAVTKHANRLELPFAWQSRFHDHIIRNDAEYYRIEKYILNNPKNWKEDKFSPHHGTARH